MPILAPEATQFPETLFAEETEEGPPGTDRRRWWVLHAKPRQEKCLARQLGQAQVPFYLPVFGRRSLVRGRVLLSHLPLFPGYVFLMASEEERCQALATNRVVQALRVGDQSKLWNDLRQVHRLIATGKPVTPEQRLVRGAVVEIRHGALAGLKGKILREASRNRFVVQVDLIQQGASVVLDDHYLAAIPNEM